MQFKNILAIIDRAAESADTNTSLFQNKESITSEDRQSFEEWAGKSFGCIKEIISIGYGKRQVAFNPFANGSSSSPESIIISRFDEAN
ncbi:hypothetical protein CLV59_105511 [Chitinophaga dinghuensis]|uniref:Uncharacterized protein n=2 Tax=Chitinophaga dinghuensis TaxID=1539050 RepID=A0A327VY11_9BACT|nr:hypothetical protein CLV59_105511 [Chitinophaga dinghuensis]